MEKKYNTRSPGEYNLIFLANDGTCSCLFWKWLQFYCYGNIAQLLVTPSHPRRALKLVLYWHCLYYHLFIYNFFPNTRKVYVLRVLTSFSLSLVQGWYWSVSSVNTRTSCCLNQGMRKEQQNIWWFVSQVEVCTCICSMQSKRTRQIVCIIFIFVCVCLECTVCTVPLQTARSCTNVHNLSVSPKSQTRSQS